MTFTATESGTHYIAAGAYFGRGTYEVEVTDTSRTIEDDLPTTSPRTIFRGQSTRLARSRSAAPPPAKSSMRATHDWFAVELEAGKTYQIDIGRWNAVSGGGTRCGHGHLACPDDDDATTGRHLRRRNGDHRTDTPCGSRKWRTIFRRLTRALVNPRANSCRLAGPGHWRMRSSWQGLFHAGRGRHLLRGATK